MDCYTKVSILDNPANLFLESPALELLPQQLQDSLLGTPPGMATMQDWCKWGNWTAI